MERNARTPSSIADLSGATRARLAASRVFFAHQSVGQNIVEGVTALQHDGQPLGLRIVDATAGMPPEGPFFAHARLGKNGDPRSKTDQFIAALESGDRVDIAFQKYCYADIDATTDVDRVFDYYRAAVDRVHTRFPRVVLVHVTVPLMQVQAGPKAEIKKLLGRMPDHYADNIARERFNSRMRQTFGSREPLFDLAAIESSRPGEAPRPIHFRGQTLFALLPESTSDGGHLNEGMQKRVATELLLMLGRLTESASATAPEAR